MTKYFPNSQNTIAHVSKATYFALRWNQVVTHEYIRTTVRMMVKNAKSALFANARRRRHHSLVTSPYHCRLRVGILIHVFGVNSEVCAIHLLFTRNRVSSPIPKAPRNTTTCTGMDYLLSTTNPNYLRSAAKTVGYDPQIPIHNTHIYICFLPHQHFTDQPTPEPHLQQFAL